MLSKIISVGDRVELKRASTQNKNNSTMESSNQIYISKIYDILNDEKITISMPIVEGRIIPLELESAYDLYFVSKKGLYECTGVIVDRYKQNTLYVLVLEIISNLRKYQRRQYFRLECLLDFKFKLLIEEELELYCKNKEYITVDGLYTNGIALDISGGGMRFISSKKFQINDKILIILNLYVLNENQEFGILSEVKATDVVKNRNGLYETRIEFLDLDTKVRESIIKFIFEQDRIQRRKTKD